jgi:hypothetical protein
LSQKLKLIGRCKVYKPNNHTKQSNQSSKPPKSKQQNKLKPDQKKKINKKKKIKQCSSLNREQQYSPWPIFVNLPFPEI